MKNTIIQRILNEQENSNVIICLLGKTGSGKTLYQTEEYVIPALLEGIDVYCCYWLNWNLPNYHYFSPRDFDEIKNKRNAMIVFDEVAQSFDPRDWEKENSDVRSFFQLHRHRHLDIICNTQDISLVAKTIGIQTHKWLLCEKREHGLLIKIILMLLGFKQKNIRIDLTQMTYQQMKKMAMGWEIGEIYNPEKEDNNYDRIKLPKNMIIHQELNEYKIEIVHKYCPKCKMRQGTIIKKEETDEICFWNNKEKKWELNKKEYCPKHPHTELEVRESGMYDTDYEPEQKEKEIIIKAFTKKEIWSEYKGWISEEQEKQKKEKEKQVKKELKKNS